ncbi:hypothetical protein QK912_04845 [Lactococcus lactis]|uniref:hypothetical protein n=1 Tax=Lactococcus lactis TaxID=1358 RepID=UPI003A7FE78F
MTNLYDETVTILERYDKTIADIEYIGTLETKINTHKALELMKKTNYDDGFGSQEIADNLMIRGNGFVMTRGEYDGSEWWDYMQTDPSLPQVESDVKSFEANIGWESLEEINGLEDTKND